MRALIVACMAVAVAGCASPERSSPRKQPADLPAAAVARVSDKATLASIALTDPDPRVSSAAMRRIQVPVTVPQHRRRAYVAELLTDQRLLAELAGADADPLVREAAVGRLTDQAALGRIALADPAANVRCGALKRVASQEVLAQAALDDKETSCREIAVQRLDPGTATPVLVQIALTRSGYEAETAVRRINDQDALFRIALDRSSASFARQAVGRITDQGLLIRLMRESQDGYVRLAVVSKLTDSPTLVEVASSDKDSLVRDAAVRQIRDPSALLRVVLEAASPQIKRQALGRLTDQPALLQVAHSSADIPLRIEATHRLSDPALLASLALEDRSEALRCAATTQLQDRATLQRVSQKFKASAVGEVADLALLLREVSQQARTGDLKLTCAVRPLPQHYASSRGSQTLTLTGEHVQVVLIKGDRVLREGRWSSKFPDLTGKSGAPIPKAVVDVFALADALLREVRSAAPGAVQQALHSASAGIRRAGRIHSADEATLAQIAAGERDVEVRHAAEARLRVLRGAR